MQRDWRDFKALYGNIEGARDGFEDACEILFRKKYPDFHVSKMAVKQGDGGIDIFIGEFGVEPIIVIQCKFFLDEFKESQQAQVRESFNRAIKSDKYELKEWVLCIPRVIDIDENAWWFKWKKKKIDENNKLSNFISLINGNELIDLMREHDVYNQIFQMEDSLRIKEIHDVLIPKKNEFQKEKHLNQIIENLLPLDKSRYITIELESADGNNFKKIHIEEPQSEIIEVNQDKANKNVVVNEINYDVEKIAIVKGDKNLGTITLKTVPVEVDGKILNVSIYPVTFEEYDLFCEDTNQAEKINTYIKNDRDKYPVVKITLDKAFKYCEWLRGYNPDSNYRLLSSHEWEKIAEQDLLTDINYDDYIWHKDNTDNSIQKIGIKQAGRLGIFDLFGNIEEICNDGVTKGYAYNSALKNILKIEKYKKLPSFPSKTIGFRILVEKNLYKHS